MLVLFDFWGEAVLWVFSICFLVTLVANLLYRLEKKRVFLVILFVSFGIGFLSVLSVFVLEYSITYLNREEVSELITEDSLVFEHYEEVNNVMLLSALKDKKYISTHRTHPLKKSKITVTTQSGEMDLLIAPDSNNPKVYWIFYSISSHSRFWELGKVRV